MNNKGYIKWHRKWLDNKWLSQSPYRTSLFLHLCSYAQHSEIKAEFNGKEIILRRGQLITGRIFLSEQTGIPTTTIDRILKAMQQRTMIGQEITAANRLITILNYDKYQTAGTDMGTQVGTDWAHTIMKKNEKKEEESLKSKTTDSLPILKSIKDNLNENLNNNINSLPAAAPAVAIVSINNVSTPKTPAKSSEEPSNNLFHTKTPTAATTLPTPILTDNNINPEGFAEYWTQMKEFKLSVMLNRHFKVVDQDIESADLFLGGIADEYHDADYLMKFVEWYLNKQIKEKKLTNNYLYLSKLSDAIIIFYEDNPYYFLQRDSIKEKPKSKEEIEEEEDRLYSPEFVWKTYHRRSRRAPEGKNY